MAEPNTPEPPGTATEDNVQADLDALSLNQALIDFEVANARVVDLTQRLIESLDECVRLRAQLETLRADHYALQQAHHGAVTSRAYKLAERLNSLRRMLLSP